MLAKLTPDVKYPRLIKFVELGNQIARCIVRLSGLFLANVSGSVTGVPRLMVCNIHTLEGLIGPKKFPRTPVNRCNKLNAGLVPGYQARRRRFWGGFRLHRASSFIDHLRGIKPQLSTSQDDAFFLHTCVRRCSLRFSP